MPVQTHSTWSEKLILIEPKVVTVTGDNTSNMDVAAKTLQILKHGHFTHSLNPAANRIYTITRVSSWASKINVTNSVWDMVTILSSVPASCHWVMTRKVIWCHHEVDLWPVRYKMSSRHHFSYLTFVWNFVIVAAWSHVAKVVLCEVKVTFTFDLWPPKSNQLTLYSKQTFAPDLIKIPSRRYWDMGKGQMWGQSDLYLWLLTKEIESVHDRVQCAQSEHWCQIGRKSLQTSCLQEWDKHGCGQHKGIDPNTV